MSHSLFLARLATLCCALLLLPAQRASAYLESNGSFGAGLTDWTTSGTWSHDTTDGIFDTNSALATGSGTQSISQCVDVSSIGANGTAVVMGNVKTPGHTSPVSAKLEIFTSADCTSGFLAGTLDQRSTVGSADSWQILYTPIVLPAGVLSARVTFAVDHDARGTQSTKFDLLAVRESLVVAGTFNFEVYVASFFQASGTWTWAENLGWSRPANGGTPLGAVQGSVAEDGSTKLVQCLDLSAAPPSNTLLSLIRIEANGNWTGAFDGEYDYRLTFRFHDAAACTGTQIDVISPWVEPSGPGWWSFYNTVSVPPGAVTLRLEVELEPSGSNTENATFLVEDLVVMPLGTQIFADGFESGSTSAWN